jgi:peptidoglycan-N-acetylglucosamine deacetylase
MRRTAIATLLLGSLALPAAASATATAAPRTVLAALEHGDRQRRLVALTFDACTTRAPSPYDPRITAELEALHVPATVFVGGGWAAEEPAALVALAGDPLVEIGNHTYTHPHLTRLPEAAIRDELLRTQREIAALTGRTPTLFRPPYGEYDAHVLRAAAEVGLRTVEYDLPSGDPDPRATTAGLVRWVLARARPGSIVVMHINHPAFHTAQALPGIVEGLRARGYTLVTIGELLRASSGPAVAAGLHARPPHRAASRA